MSSDSSTLSCTIHPSFPGRHIRPPVAFVSSLQIYPGVSPFLPCLAFSLILSADFAPQIEGEARYGSSSSRSRSFPSCSQFSFCLPVVSSLPCICSLFLLVFFFLLFPFSFMPSVRRLAMMSHSFRTLPT